MSPINSTVNSTFIITLSLFPWGSISNGTKPVNVKAPLTVVEGTAFTTPIYGVTNKTAANVKTVNMIFLFVQSPPFNLVHFWNKEK